MTDDQRAFIVLVCAGIGHGTIALPNSIDRESVRQIASKQGLLAVAKDTGMIPLMHIILVIGEQSTGKNTFF